MVRPSLTQSLSSAHSFAQPVPVQLLLISQQIIPELAQSAPVLQRPDVQLVCDVMQMPLEQV